MSNETVFYILGISLVVAALIVSAIGLRVPSFPPNRGVLLGVVAIFVVLVGATATFAVMNAQDEQAKTEAEAAAEGTSTEAGTPPSETPTQAAPGGTTTSGEVSKGPTVKISANPSGALAFEQKSVTAPAGDINIAFTNNSPVGHNVQVQDSEGNQLGGTDLVTDASAEATVHLDSGTYLFYCSVPGHEEAGMKGKFIVK